MLRPVVEMSVLGMGAAEIVQRWTVPGPAGLLACAALATVLPVYGFFRLFSAAGRPSLAARLASGVAR